MVRSIRSFLDRIVSLRFLMCSIGRVDRSRGWRGAKGNLEVLSHRSRYVMIDRGTEV